MLKIQEFLKVNSIQSLTEKYAIKVSYSEDGRLAIFNYNQIKSDKRDILSREARSLCLELDSGNYDIVARSFFRFLNYEEDKYEDSKFDWSNISAEEKVDGSLITLYYFDGSWRINTRSTFGNLEIAEGVGKTWSEVFFSLINVSGLDVLNKNLSYVFELCSRWNRVVKTYEKDCVYLLAAVQNRLGVEVSELLLDGIANQLQCLRPERYNFTKIEDIVSFVKNHPESTFEGCILKDGKMRLKCKNPAYVALSHLKNGGNGFAPDKLVELIFKGDVVETFIFFPEIATKTFEIIKLMEGEKAKAKIVYECAKKFKTQKEFAIFVNANTSISSFCFNARKKNLSFDEVWDDEAQEYWIKNIKKYLV